VVQASEQVLVLVLVLASEQVLVLASVLASEQVLVLASEQVLVLVLALVLASEQVGLRFHLVLNISIPIRYKIPLTYHP
jgi:hypothetical protein